MNRNAVAIAAMAIGLGVAASLAVPTARAQGPRMVIGYKALPVSAHARAGLVFDGPSALSVATVSPTDAMDAARERVGAMADAAETATVSLGVFSDTQYAEPQASSGFKPLIERRLCYLVTFDGVQVLSHARSSSVNTSWTVVVDAKTGDVLEEFSVE